MGRAFSTPRRPVAFAVAAAAVVAVVAVVAVGWLGPPGSPAPSAPATMTLRPVRGFVPLRFVPPGKGPCRSADLSLHVVPTAPPDRRVVASVTVLSTRACRLGGRQSVTPRRADGRAAAAPVDFGGRDTPITVSPGHGASLWIGFADQICGTDNHTPAAIVAAAFSYDLGPAQGMFRLTQPVAACPMNAGIESSDIYTKGAVDLLGPATIDAGGRYDAHVDLYYRDTTAVILDPCPTMWARVSPQSAPEFTQSWELACHGMRPVTFGDHVGIDLALTIPAGLASQFVDISVGFGLPSPPAPAPAGPAAARLTGTQRTWVTGDRPLQPVPFVAVPAPPAPLLRRTTRPACDVTDLAVGNLNLPSNGASGEVTMPFTLVNVSGHPCTLLKDTPVRLSGPGQGQLTVPVGDGIVPASVNGELEAGASTTVLLEVGSSCDQAAPVVNYTSVNIELPHGTLVVPFPVADRCGVGTPGLGVNGDTASAHDPVDVIDIHAPRALARGRPTTIQVTINSFDGAELWRLGYAVTIAGVETRLGFATAAIQRLLPDLPTVFDVQVDPAASLPPGPTTLRFEILTGTVPAAEVPVTLT